MEKIKFPPAFIKLISCFITSFLKDQIKTNKFFGFMSLISFFEIILIFDPGVYFLNLLWLASQINFKLLDLIPQKFNTILPLVDAPYPIVSLFLERKFFKLFLIFSTLL